MPTTLATPRVITRASDNQMVWRWDNAAPFGEDQPDESPSRLAKFVHYNPRFPGQVYDKETNTTTTTSEIMIHSRGGMYRVIRLALMAGSTPMRMLVVTLFPALTRWDLRI